MAQQFKYIGTPRTYVDAYERVTGKARFAGDLTKHQLPGMLYAHTLLSPYPHARIVKIDTSEAERMEGVKAIVTGKDVKEMGIRPLFVNWEILPVEKVRFVGQAVAAVAAENEYIARLAAQAIKVEYERLPFVLDPEEALRPGSPEIHKGGNLIGGKPSPVYTKGDVSKGFQESDVVLEDVFETQTLQHANLEPHVAVAQWIGDRLTVWVSTQWVHNFREAIANSLGIPVNKVRAIGGGFMGGGLGDKALPAPAHIIAALLAKKAGRPVKLYLDRNEYYLQATQRYAVRTYIKIGLKRDGRLLAIECKQYADAGAFFMQGAPSASTNITDNYKYEHLKYEGYNVYTNKPKSGFKRCVGHPQSVFTIESMVDMAAERLGIDPVEFRLKNTLDLEDKHTLTGLPFSRYPVRIKDVIKLAAEKFEWRNRWRGWKRPTLEEGPIRRGIGVAITVDTHGSAGGRPGSAMVKLNFDGTVDILAGAADLGGGQKTTLSIIVAEELGIPVEKIHIFNEDTDAVPDTGMTAGSTQSPRGGTAVARAARDLKQRVFEIAADVLKAKTEELVSEEGLIFVKGAPDKKVSYADVARRAPWPLIGWGGMHRPAGVIERTFGCHMGEIEVDVETGLIKVVDYVAVHDSGTVVNPKAFEAQVHGGIVQGIGFALFEEQAFDPVEGGSVTPSYLFSPLPTTIQTPPIKVYWVETPDPHTHFGQKGIGEPPTALPAAVIANALYNATGVRVRKLPITPKQVIDGLKALRGG